MTLFEALKTTFTRDDIELKKPSNSTDLIHRTKTITDDPFSGAMVLSQLDNQDYNFSQGMNVQSYQNSLIERYRELATDSEVSNGIDIICNEMIYTIDKDIFKIDINEENDKIKDTISKTFENVLSLINIKENIFTICRQMYIDGQLNISLVYKNGKVKEGIQKAYILEPQGLYYDKKTKEWKYQDEENSIGSLYAIEDIKNETYSESELVHVDYGLLSKFVDDNKLTNQINLSYLEGVFKNANMLQTLENMLVPLRYSRSVSRRLFNIDVADLAPKSAKELMDKIRSEFRYKKSYDPATGTIKNIKATQPMVEDYWMSNRGGSRGTTVDTMDEKGGLMDMEDIIYTAKKLYNSMKIPSSRNPYSDESPSFSFDDTSVTQEELSFYIFISRLRIPITKLIKEIMRRELVAIGTFTDKEWKGFEKKIIISFGNEAIFLENMKQELFLKSVENFVGMKDIIGETVSLQTAISKTFGWSSEQLDSELTLMLEERENPLYKAFYGRDEEGDRDWAL